MSDYATPRPWKITDTDGDLYISAPNVTIADCTSWSANTGQPNCPESDESHANAELIVRAVNSHDALVEALEKSVGRLNKTAPCPHDSLDTRLGSGKVWARCEDCGETIEQKNIETYRQRAAEHEKFIGEALEALALARPVKL
jgi:hypothetical protein